ncbi:DUF423 domain-containing protein [Dokdonella sp.]|uniref:DUF423 domain-containing protein n=1 Tax=Dokdonella sp. TaxID=2291710 RepID=UPI0025BFD7C3|nr:DUF423 domain-containing protein [Dokdonella sp.]MBX3692621.1 DUF423 domain-containing protein [Dokdonella sp.]MCW5569361.1 DUF423 domain-containing protein [Dokdonella sp.]
MTAQRARLAGIVAAVLGALAVACGAFGAHALRARVDADALAVWGTAVDYQFWHALALCVAALRMPHGGAAAMLAAIAFGAGCLLFCGSLYALALGAPRVLGMVTPFGGVAFIIGWIALAWSWRERAPT